ncbi:lysophosphatidylcholine acyltransferase 1-like isoform X1 [Chiloscyllium plagiosum]|uniref:lysophosphatidylcholine acyltransferase 1-like isoform X1 n=1 Tax=Chiloscyllium plagiosum TaxID=36176 RepID=UPI001CB8378D|nr:lysophosphatidylcholine acyltransferase 1-like isoform X1 [Chiloscyllium plagiosum]
MRLLRRGRCTAKVSGACGNEEEEERARLPPVRNPFVHDIRLSVLQKVQLAIMTVTLFPIRLLLAAFMMLLAWPFAFLAAWGRIEKESERPMNMWRKTLDFMLKVIMRAMWFAGGFHWMTIKGRRALPKEAPIITLAPHSSYFDAIPVTMTMASIVMKAESKDIPIWGTLIKYIRPVLVSRSDQYSRRKTVEEIKQRALSNGRWPQVMIFPEGTCTNRSCLITFKPGAFIPGVPVQPVVLRYPNKMDTITWTWQGPGALKILWLTLCQLHNNVEIEFLPIYTPSEEEKRNPILYANNVRKVMANALGVPVTDYTFEDCQLVMSDSQLKLPVDTCLLEFAKLARKLNLKPDKIEKELDELAESAKKMKGGLTTLETFAHYLKLPICDALRDMFLLFTENENGTIDIREYVIALSVVSRPSKTHETIKLAFRMYESIDQTITEDDLACILKTALGVNKLDVSKLFTVIDATQQRKISYMDFCKFSHANPDYAEEYLYPHQMMAVTDCMEKQLAATANGFCTDFSPDLHEEDKEDGTLDKKIN